MLRLDMGGGSFRVGREEFLGEREGKKPAVPDGFEQLEIAGREMDRARVLAVAIVVPEVRPAGGGRGGSGCRGCGVVHRFREKVTGGTFVHASEPPTSP